MAKQPNRPICPAANCRAAHNDAQCRAAVGHQIHDGDGIQLHGEHFHGDAPEALGLLVHPPMAFLVRLINFQSGQALQIFQKTLSPNAVYWPQ